MNEGWLCPKCGSAHAPSVLTCPVTTQAIPFWPQRYPSSVRSDCSCPLNNVCMNVACPRSVRVTCAVAPSTDTLPQPAAEPKSSVDWNSQGVNGHINFNDGRGWIKCE